jgi:hypothetical protein
MLIFRRAELSREKAIADAKATADALAQTRLENAAKAKHSKKID